MFAFMAVAVSMAHDYGAAMHPFFMPRNSLEPSAETDFDQNEGRRKRQRTTSSEAAPRFSVDTVTSIGAEKRTAAASKGPQAVDDILKSTTPEDSQSEQFHVDESHHPLKARLLGESEDSAATVNEEGSESKENVQLSGVGLDKKLTATPPKKMLRVRPDGKLGSPKAKAPVQDPKPKRGRKSAKAKAASNRLMIIIKYGSDEDSRLSMGRKIDEILSGLATIHAPVREKPTKPIESPKPTHPFFLGGTVLVASPHKSTTSSDQKKPRSDASPTRDQRKTLTPRRLRVTSKPADIPENRTKEIPFGVGSNTFGSDHARVCRFPGAIELIWPPADMLHVGRPETSLSNLANSLRAPQSRNASRKLKGVEVSIPDEDDVLKPYIGLVRTFQRDDKLFHQVKSRDWRKFRRPLRRLMTGQELQKAINPRLASRLDAIESSDVDELSIPQRVNPPAHIALRHLYDRIASSRSAFDQFECETQDWMHKYAPKAAEDVLQQSHEVVLLRDWLKGLTIRSVESREIRSSGPAGSSVNPKRRGGNANKKKRKRAIELDGFVVSSDEEAYQMDEVTDPEDYQPTNSLVRKSVIRSGDATGILGNGDRSSNAVVISGPHGCGKTAAVYAVAQELGFEVFEINAASRRSGRDILDRVGDMTRNHLVRQDPRDEVVAKDETEEQQRASEQMKIDLESGRQGTMKSFFKPAIATKKQSLATNPSPRKTRFKADEQPQKQQSQKQSLILLEEVDVLFEEDKMFWLTVLELILQSKRPIVMTCTDERLVPLDDIALYAIFRFGPPADQLAVDYLLLIACNEGHLLPRNAVAALYKSKRSDLRASIAELNFFCQMAIGDAKGGLDWMLIQSNSDGRQEPRNEPSRVVSEGTYQNGMGWLSGELSTSTGNASICQEAELLLQAWDGWEIDVGAHDGYLDAKMPVGPEEISGRQIVEALERLEQASEALSAADTFPACVSRACDKVLLDTDPPGLTEKTRNSYVEGSNILQADPAIDQSILSELLAITMRTCVRRLLNCSDSSPDARLLTNQSITSTITQTIEGSQQRKPLTKASISPAFDPISRSQKAVLGITKGPQISTFDGPLSVLAEDIAPYVRSIVSYDLRLEEQRRQLSSLLSHPGKNGKKARTTRASWAALEGGSKAHTRRERWFPKNTNFDAVLRTGGKGWQDVLLQRTAAAAAAAAAGDDNGVDECRRSSLGSAVESDA